MHRLEKDLVVEGLTIKGVTIKGVTIKGLTIEGLAVKDPTNDGRLRTANIQGFEILQWPSSPIR